MRGSTQWMIAINVIGSILLSMLLAISMLLAVSLAGSLAVSIHDNGHLRCSQFTIIIAYGEVILAYGEMISVTENYHDPNR
jgi:low temperature requirement protein LtrA